VTLADLLAPYRVTGPDAGTALILATRATNRARRYVAPIV
jgi:hypothetical protein